MSSRWLAAGSAVVALGLLAACTSAAPTSHPKVPVFATSTVRASPVPTTPPKGCDEVASAADVNGIIGHPLAGSANQVIGIPEAAIHRTARLDCYYGIPAGQPVTAGVLSIGIGSYTDPPSAAHRTTVTVSAARDNGASTSDVQFDGGDAVVIAGVKNQELVLSRDDLTVLVSADNGVLASAHVGQQLMRLAQRALDAHP